MKCKIVSITTQLSKKWRHGGGGWETATITFHSFVHGNKNLNDIGIARWLVERGQKGVK